MNVASRTTTVQRAPRSVSAVTAVILVAGGSSRLRPLTDATPKCLLRVGGVPILQRALATLQDCGVEHFLIVTGYLGDQVRRSAAAWRGRAEVAFVHNDRWATTNNSYSLLLAVEALEERAFLLLDGDVVFDRSVADSLLRAPYANSFALRPSPDLGDEEMKALVDPDRRLRAISKEVPPESAAGEAVGLWHFASGSAIAPMLRDRVCRRGLCDEWYETSIQQAVQCGVEFHAVDVGGHFVVEIDTPEDLAAANRAVGALCSRATP